MLVDEKPPLDEDLLKHYGIPGMKWGVRRDRTGNPPMSKTKKVAIGTAAAVGTAALLYNPTTRRYTGAVVKKSMRLGASATGAILRKVGRTTVSAISKASQSLGITGKQVPRPKPVKIKLTGRARIRASYLRGKRFFNPPPRSRTEQVKTLLRLPMALVTTTVV